jgi:hypothetical protein
MAPECQHGGHIAEGEQIYASHKYHAHMDCHDATHGEYREDDDDATLEYEVEDTGREPDLWDMMSA